MRGGLGRAESKGAAAGEVGASSDDGSTWGLKRQPCSALLGLKIGGEDKNGGAGRLLERIRTRSSGGRGSPMRGVVAGMGVRHGRREL